MLAVEGGVVGLWSELLEKTRMRCRQRMVQDADTAWRTEARLWFL